MTGPFRAIGNAFVNFGKNILSNFGYAQNRGMYYSPPINFTYNSYMPTSMDYDYSFMNNPYNVSNPLYAGFDTYSFGNSYGAYGSLSYSSYFEDSTPKLDKTSLNSSTLASSTNTGSVVSNNKPSSASSVNQSSGSEDSEKSDYVKRFDNSGIKGVKKKLDPNLYGPKFLARVKEIAKNINCNYRDLLAIMNSESGLRADIKNLAGGAAVGLIQFMPQTAKSLGTTSEALRKMTPIEQLDYVEKFFIKLKTKTFGASAKLTAPDLYALVFLPARAKNFVLTQKGEKYYEPNKKTDIRNDNDGKITKDDLWELIKDRYVDDASFDV